MDALIIERIRIRCQNAANRLQAEAYAQQSNGGRRKLKQFFPCARGLVFSKELAKEFPRVLSEIENEALLTPCGCKAHNNLTANKMIEYACGYPPPPPGTTS